jgi:hypothetical protein
MYKYLINIAKEIEERRGNKFGPFYFHYFRIEKEHASEDEIRELIADLQSRFPEPKFSVSCTRQNLGCTEFN